MQSVWILPEEEENRQKGILKGILIKLFLSLKLDS